MAGVTRILTFICVAGCHLSPASPVPRSALVVPAGGNVSLTCNLTSSLEVTWYRLRADQLLPLLTVAPSKLKGRETINYHTADDRRFKNRGDPEGGPLHLEIQQVEEKDAGLYFCTGRGEAAVCVNRGIHLAVDGVDGEPSRQPCWSLGICVLPALLVLCLVFIVGLCLRSGVDGEPSRQPCWSLGICVLPALLVLCLVFIVGLCLRSGKAAVCCCDADTSQRVTEEESLHYSSLKHADKPRPSGRGGTGLVEDDVTYSAVMSRKNPNASRDRR